MCTGIFVKTKKLSLFGRNLDYEKSFDESIVFVPRYKKVSFRYLGELNKHYAFLGICHLDKDTPLFYDAMNEYSLCIAGLNFVGECTYFPYQEGKINICSFELITYLLSTCKSVKDAKVVLEKMNITNDQYKNYSLSYLHWIIADENESIILEQTKEGIKIYDDDIGVLTNNPPYLVQRYNLNNYQYLSSKQVNNNFSSSLDFKKYSRGMGLMGLPGDNSSSSRYVRAAFMKWNSIFGDSVESNINQFFHILNSVEQIKGSCEVAPNEFEYTLYSSCYNLKDHVLYYKTYDDFSIKSISLEDLDSNKIKKWFLN